jgi:PAS domain S-box-containing protein
MFINKTVGLLDLFMVLNSAYSKKIHEAVLIEKNELTLGIWTLAFRVEGDFSFIEGQYVWLELSAVVKNCVGGNRRAFSLINKPNSSGRIEVLFHSSESAFKQKILQMQLGDKLQVIGPFGNSFAFTKNTADLVLICRTVGIAPFLSLIRQRADSLTHKITLICATKKIEEMQFAGELREIERNNKNFKLVVIEDHQLSSTLSTYVNHSYKYGVCGSQDFVDKVYTALGEQGILRDNFVFEQFYPSSFLKKENYDFYAEAIGGFEEVRTELLHKIIPFLIVFGFITTVFLGFYFYFSSSPFFANIVSAIVLVILGILWYGFNQKKMVLQMSLALSYSFITIPLFIYSVENLTIYWIYFFPVLAFLFDYKRGKYWVVLLIATMLVYFTCVVFGLVGSALGLAALLNVIGGLIFTSLIAFFFGKIEQNHVNLAKESARKLSIFRQAVESTSNHVVITDENGTVMFANEAAQQITGFKLDEIIKNTPRLWGGEMSVDYYQKLWKTKSKGASYHGEVINRRRSGELYTALAHISPITKSGRVIGYVATEEDITRLKELDKLKDEFVSLASHELRTPMTAIKGFVSMIVDGDYGKVNENIKQPLKDVQESTERLISLVNDMLDTSRIESGRLKYELSLFDIGETVREVADSLSPIAEDKNLKLKISGSGKITVFADVNKIKQVLNNLIGNSLKFTDRGSIEVFWKEKSDVVTVYVKDTGIGMSLDVGDELFGKFVQVHDLNKGRPAGTGLGLYISKQMIEKMGGEVWVEESIVGKGSIFAFSLLSASNKKIPQIKEKLINHKV